MEWIKNMLQNLCSIIYGVNMLSFEIFIQFKVEADVSESEKKTILQLSFLNLLRCCGGTAVG